MMGSRCRRRRNTCLCSPPPPNCQRTASQPASAPSLQREDPQPGQRWAGALQRSVSRGFVWVCACPCPCPCWLAAHRQSAVGRACARGRLGLGQAGHLLCQTETVPYPAAPAALRNV